MFGVPDERGEDADRPLRTSFALYVKTGNALFILQQTCCVLPPPVLVVLHSIFDVKLCHLPQLSRRT